MVLARRLIFGHIRARQRVPRVPHTRVHSTSTPTSGYEHRKSRARPQSMHHFLLSTPAVNATVSMCSRSITRHERGRPACSSAARRRLLSRAARPASGASRRARCGKQCSCTRQRQRQHVLGDVDGRSRRTALLGARSEAPFSNAFEFVDLTKCGVMLPSRPTRWRRRGAVRDTAEKKVVAV